MASFESNKNQEPGVVNDLAGSKVEVLKENDKWYGDVYYIDNEGSRKLIAKSYERKVAEGFVPERGFYYRAELSPNLRFIYLLSDCWECNRLEVYDVETESIYDTKFYSFEVNWLPDSRLRIVGPCQPMTGCGIFESVSAEMPWEMKKLE